MIDLPPPLTGEEEGGRRLREPLARRGVDKEYDPLPFTLLDKFFNRPCSPPRVLSNRVNPLPPRGGESFRFIFEKSLLV